MIQKHNSSLKLTIVAAFAFLGFATTGCSTETGEDQKISSALSCLDVATSATEVNTCVAKVEGMTSSKAALIRCSGNFIAQGLTGNRLANAFKQQSSGATGANPSTTMAAYLVFNPNLTGHSASDTMTNCQQSGVKSMIGLASLVQVASTIATISGSLPANLDPANLSQFNEAAIKTQIQQLVTNLTAQDPAALQTAAAIGTAAQAAQAAYCGVGSSLSSQDLCKKLNEATSQGTDTQNIGMILINALNK